MAAVFSERCTFDSVNCINMSKMIRVRDLADGTLKSRAAGRPTMQE